MLKEDDFARENIAPENGISRNSFSEAINNRGLEQLKYVFEKLSIEASNVLPGQHADLGNLVAFDGSFIDAVLSMTWADYRKGSEKAKAHPGFNLNQGIPAKFFLTAGNEDVELFYPKANRTGRIVFVQALFIGNLHTRFAVWNLRSRVRLCNTPSVFCKFLKSSEIKDRNIASYYFDQVFADHLC